MNLLEHDKELSGNSQTFWLTIPDPYLQDNANDYANYRAWMAIGQEEGEQDYETLSKYNRARWDLSKSQTLLIEAVRYAYHTPEIIWLIKNDVEFEVHPRPWFIGVDDMMVKVIIEDANDAMRFKLTFGSAA